MKSIIVVCLLVNVAADDLDLVQLGLHQAGREPSSQLKPDKHSRHHETANELSKAITALAADAKTKALPKSIQSMLAMIRNQTSLLHKAIVDEHKDQGSNLDATFDAIGSCSIGDTSALEEGSSSLKGLAQAAKASLCACRKQEAQNKANALGCNQQLSCLNELVASSLSARQNFLRDMTAAPPTPKDMYASPGGQDMCGNSTEWQGFVGATTTQKALNWFASQKNAWDAHWDNKLSSLEELVRAYDQAKADHDDLRDRNETGCAALDSLSASFTHEGHSCSTWQARATMNQCYFHGQKTNLCNNYTQCRNSTEAAWEAAKAREQANGADRQNAYARASTIECTLNAFVENDAGELTVDGDAVTKCANVECDAKCQEKLKAADVDRTIPERAKCSLPASPCAAESPRWEPTCDTDGWGSFSPNYFVGERNPPNCVRDAGELNLADYAVTEECQACGA